MWKKMERWCQLAVVILAVGAAVISLYSRITALEVGVKLGFDNVEERLGRIERRLPVAAPKKLAERR